MFCCFAIIFTFYILYRPKAELEKQAAKRKAEDERISKLSAADQRKVSGLSTLSNLSYADSSLAYQALERERKRAIKKSQGKVVKK